MASKCGSEGSQQDTEGTRWKDMKAAECGERRVKTSENYKTRLLAAVHLPFVKAQSQQRALIYSGPMVLRDLINN